ncbi:MAG: OmpP1/FadL family transporter [Bradymonadaceae bacterium]
MNKVKIIAGLAAAVALVGFGDSAHAAGFANTAQSGTATGMAGVATANPDEPNSNFYNPAAMTFRDEINVYIGPTFILPSVDYTSPQGVEDQTEPAFFYPPNLNVSVPLGENFAAGVGVTLPWGLAITWPENWLGRETFVSQDLRTLNINPNFAYRLSDIDLSFAAGTQIIRSDIQQSRAFVPRDGDDMAVMLGGVGHGVGGTFAVMYQPLSTVTLGLNYRSAVKINFDGHVHFRGVEGTPFEQVMIDQAISTSLTVPHVLNVGVGWNAMESLFVGLDVNYMTWSTYDKVEINYATQSPEGPPTAEHPTGPPTVAHSDWNDAIAVRLGAEFEVVENLKLRTGFAYDMTPVPAETAGPSLPDNNRYVIGAGAGYTWNGIRSDLGYNLIIIEERVVDNGNADGTYQMSAHVIGFNVGYGF